MNIYENIPGIENAVNNAPLAIREEFISLSALFPFTNHNSAPRGTMMLGQFAQPITILKPEPRIIQVGLENQLSGNTFKCIVENDCIIRNIITTPDVYDIQNTEIIYIIVEDSKGRMDVIDVPLYHAVTEFGFRYIRNQDVLSDIMVGTRLKAGTVLADSPSNVNGIYSWGLNAEIMLLTDPATGQDGIIASNELMCSMAYKKFYKIEASWDDTKIPLNVYGDKDNYKPFPTPGDTVSDESMVLALRAMTPDDIPSSIYDCMNIDPIYDECYYTDANKILSLGEGEKVINNRVISTKVYKSEVKKDNNIHGKEFIDLSVQKLKNVYTKVIKAYETSNNKNISPALQRLLVNALAISNPSKDKVELRHRNDAFTTRVEIILETTVIPGIGSKISDFSGAKGIVVDVRPREVMGCDIIMDPTSLPGRMNPGRIIETYIMGSSRNAKEIITRTYHQLGAVEAMKLVVDYLSYLGTEQFYIYKTALEHNDIVNIEKAIRTIVEKEFYIYYKVSSKHKMIPIIRNLEKSSWNLPKRKILIDGKISRKFISVYPGYVFLISKTADSYLSCASPYLNHYGLPVKPPSNIKALRPWSNTPTKNIGETEFRVLCTNTNDPEFVAELADRATSINTHKMLYAELLVNPLPTNIDRIVDRSIHRYGEGSSLSLFNDILETMGIETTFENEERGPNEEN